MAGVRTMFSHTCAGTAQVVSQPPLRCQTGEAPSPAPAPAPRPPPRPPLPPHACVHAQVNSVMDFLVSIGMRPIVELSFMPELLASNASATIFHYKVGKRMCA